MRARNCAKSGIDRRMSKFKGRTRLVGLECRRGNSSQGGRAVSQGEAPSEARQERRGNTQM